MGEYWWVGGLVGMAVMLGWRRGGAGAGGNVNGGGWRYILGAIVLLAVAFGTLIENTKATVTLFSKCSINLLGMKTKREKTRKRLKPQRRRGIVNGGRRAGFQR